MTLLDLCEPLFQYICRLSRSARKGGHYELGQVAGEVKNLLAEARGKAAAGPPGMAEQYEKVENALIFFVDFMIKESALPFAKEWKELAFERNELAGDEKFFDLLEETLKDRSPAANERLAVFYHCLGLGFTGWYTGQPEYLRRKMKELAARMQTGSEGAGDAARICPDAYEHVDTRDLVEPPGTKLLGIAIGLVGLILVLFVANAYLYHANAAEMNKALDEINTRKVDVPAVPVETARKESN